MSQRAASRLATCIGLLCIGLLAASCAADPTVSQQAERLAPSATADATQSPTPLPTPSATPEPGSSAPTATRVPELTTQGDPGVTRGDRILGDTADEGEGAAEPTPDAEPGNSESADPAPEPEPEPTSQTTAEPEPTSEATAEPEPTSEPQPTSEPTAEPEPTPTVSYSTPLGGGRTAPPDGDSRSNPRGIDDDGFLLGEVSAPEGDNEDWSVFTVTEGEPTELMAGVVCETFESPDGTGLVVLTMYEGEDSIGSVRCGESLSEDFEQFTLSTGLTYFVEVKFTGSGYAEWFFESLEE